MNLSALIEVADQLTVDEARFIWRLVSARTAIRELNEAPSDVRAATVSEAGVSAPVSQIESIN